MQYVHTLIWQVLESFFKFKFDLIECVDQIATSILYCHLRFLIGSGLALYFNGIFQGMGFPIACESDRLVFQQLHAHHVAKGVIFFSNCYCAQANLFSCEFDCLERALVKR